MASSCAETVEVRFTPDEHRLLEDLAAMRGVTTSDLVRELMGFERADDARLEPPHLQLVTA